MYTDNYFNRFELAPEVAEALKKMTEDGVYPEKLS